MKKVSVNMEYSLILSSILCLERNEFNQNLQTLMHPFQSLRFMYHLIHQSQSITIKMPWSDVSVDTSIPIPKLQSQSLGLMYHLIHKSQSLSYNPNPKD